MKHKCLIALALITLSLSASRGFAAEKGAAIEFKDLETRIRVKLQQGKKTELDLAPELKEFDALLAKYKDEKTDEVAEILVMEANLYLQVLDNTDKGTELVKKLQRDFPETELGRNAYQMLEAIKKQETAKKLQAALQIGTKFPDFKETDTAGQPLSLTNYQRKVVLVDFWATWCEPYVAELTNVFKIYEKYHAQGFEIIGINLDEDKRKFAAFTQEKKINWPQFCDGQGWLNKLAVKYGVHRIPATYLLDGEGKIIGQNLRGEDLDKALSKTLAKP